MLLSTRLRTCQGKIIIISLFLSLPPSHTHQLYFIYNGWNTHTSVLLAGQMSRQALVKNKPRAPPVHGFLLEEDGSVAEGN